MPFNIFPGRSAGGTGELEVRHRFSALCTTAASTPTAPGAWGLGSDALWPCGRGLGAKGDSGDPRLINLSTSIL